MGSDGTVAAPDGSGRKVKLITADDVVAYLKAHPTFLADRPELAAAIAAPAAATPAFGDRPVEERARRDHRELQAEPDHPEPHPGRGHLDHPGDDLREDDPRG